MRTLNVLAIACLLALCLGLLPQKSMAQDMTARQIMEAQKDRHESGNEKATVVMLLVNRSGDKTPRLVRSWKKELPGGEHRSLMAFLEPPNLKGTALMTWGSDKGDGKQWLFLPASGRLQRVAASAKTDYFMGTDFTYEDMEPDDLNDYEFTLTGSAVVDGQDCHVIEATPATDAKRKESGYSKRIFSVRKDILFTIKVEFYDPRGRKTKVQTAHDLENVSGQMWVAKKSIMDNLRKKHKTLMGIKSREVDADIDDEVFTERFILSGRHAD